MASASRGLQVGVGVLLFSLPVQTNDFCVWITPSVWSTKYTSTVKMNDDLASQRSRMSFPPSSRPETQGTGQREIPTTKKEKKAKKPTAHVLVFPFCVGKSGGPM